MMTSAIFFDKFLFDDRLFSGLVKNFPAHHHEELAVCIGQFSEEFERSFRFCRPSSATLHIDSKRSIAAS